MERKEEAQRLVALFNGNAAGLVQFLSAQLGTVKQQTQMLLSLCGLAITVTGFSGAHMIRAGTVSSVLLIVGIALILSAAILCLHILTRLRWVSQALRDDLVETALIVITRRDHLQHRMELAGVLVALGLTAYLGAVAVAAWVGEVR